MILGRSISIFAVEKPTMLLSSLPSELAYAPLNVSIFNFESSIMEFRLEERLAVRITALIITIPATTISFRKCFLFFIIILST